RSVFILIRMYCMWCNGAPVADGGFLQVMLATRGNTDIERLALENIAMNADDILKELKRLKLRYGKLVIREERANSKRFSLGITEETISWRKRH
ncbi:hypothetical protein B0J11DRAFT_438300, partial [Dendryphion nanum]